MKNIRIGNADGPTSVFILKKNAKLTLKQKFRKMECNYKKARVERRLSAQRHTLNEVMDYIVNVHGFREADSNVDEVLEEYKEMRVSFLIRYAPELLGEYAANSPLKSADEEEVRKFLEQGRQRIQKAMEIPVTEFDIDFHKFIKNLGNAEDEMHIILENKSERYKDVVRALSR